MSKSFLLPCVEDVQKHFPFPEHKLPLDGGKLRIGQRGKARPNCGDNSAS